MKLLALETFPLKPHLETSGEILIDTLSHGEAEALFCYIGRDLPWQEYDANKGLRRIFVNISSRIDYFEKKLLQAGISLLNQASLTACDKGTIKSWARSFSGDIEALKTFSYKGYGLGLGVASSLISKYRNPSINLTELSGEVRSALEASAIVYERALALIKLHKPDVVLTFNGRFACSYPIIKAAESQGVKVKLHERGSDYDKYEVFDSSVHSLEMFRKRINQYWSNAEDSKEAILLGESFYERRRGGDGIGWKSFIGDQKRGRIIPTDGRRRVIYFSSSDDEFAAVEDGAIQQFSTKGQKSAVERLITICKKHTDIELLIRLHPNSSGCHEEELRWWFDLGRYGVTVIPPQADIDSYALAQTANVVCTYGSTMGIEAAYWGIPSILLGDAGYAGFESCFEPKNNQELEMLLLNAPTNWNRDGCLKYGYYMSTFGKKFKYFKPTSLFEGSFLGHKLPHLNYVGRFVKRLKNL